MSFSARIVKDSITKYGERLTTLEVTFPRQILSEINTHRVFSRNSASSRAIPIEKMIKRVREHPYIPTHWGKNQKGMQALEEVDANSALKAEREWRAACVAALSSAKVLCELGIHKQVTNRLLEPFMWHTAIISSTEWDNFFHLRCHPDAHPEMRKIAEMMKQAIENSTPVLKNDDEWHLPFVHDDEVSEFGIEQAIKISVGRCARVSYLTHDGKRDPQADIDLHDKLLSSGHLSPLEHQATPAVGCSLANSFRISNFNLHWVQYRKLIEHESDILGA